MQKGLNKKFASGQTNTIIIHIPKDYKNKSEQQLLCIAQDFPYKNCKAHITYATPYLAHQTNI